MKWITTNCYPSMIIRQDPENNEIISTLDLPSFNNDLMKHTLPISESAPASKKSRNQVKRTKKQKPFPNIRQSYCLFPQNDLRAVSYQTSLLLSTPFPLQKRSNFREF